MHEMLSYMPLPVRDDLLPAQLLSAPPPTRLDSELAREAREPRLQAARPLVRLLGGCALQRQSLPGTGWAAGVSWER